MNISESIVSAYYLPLPFPLIPNQIGMFENRKVTHGFSLLPKDIFMKVISNFSLAHLSSLSQVDMYINSFINKNIKIITDKLFEEKYDALNIELNGILEKKQSIRENLPKRMDQIIKFQTPLFAPGCVIECMVADYVTNLDAPPLENLPLIDAESSFFYRVIFWREKLKKDMILFCKHLEGIKWKTSQDTIIESLLEIVEKCSEKEFFFIFTWYLETAKKIIELNQSNKCGGFYPAQIILGNFLKTFLDSEKFDIFINLFNKYGTLLLTHHLGNVPLAGLPVGIVKIFGTPEIIEKLNNHIQTVELKPLTSDILNILYSLNQFSEFIRSYDFNNKSDDFNNKNLFLEKISFLLVSNRNLPEDLFERMIGYLISEIFLNVLSASDKEQVTFLLIRSFMLVMEIKNEQAKQSAIDSLIDYLLDFRVNCSEGIYTQLNDLSLENIFMYSFAVNLIKKLNLNNKDKEDILKLILPDSFFPYRNAAPYSQLVLFLKSRQNLDCDLIITKMDFFLQQHRF